MDWKYCFASKHKKKNYSLNPPTTAIWNGSSGPHTAFEHTARREAFRLIPATLVLIAVCTAPRSMPCLQGSDSRTHPIRLT
jgi:hypothetical protein